MWHDVIFNFTIFNFRYLSLLIIVIDFDFLANRSSFILFPNTPIYKRNVNVDTKIQSCMSTYNVKMMKKTWMSFFFLIKWFIQYYLVCYIFILSVRVFFSQLIAMAKATFKFTFGFKPWKTNKIIKIICFNIIF